MSLVSRGKNFQFKIALQDSESSSAFQSNSSDPFSRNTGEAHKEAERYSPSVKPGMVVAQFSPNCELFTLTRFFHSRYPVHFVLKPGTKTHENMLRFLLHELQAMPGNGGRREGTLQTNSEEIARRLASYLENKLEVNSEIARFEDNNEPLDLFQNDFEVYRKGKLLEIEGKQSASKLHTLLQNIFSSLRSRRHVISKYRLPHRRRFRFFEGEVEARILTGFLSLEIEELPAERLSRARTSSETELRDAASTLRKSLQFLAPPALQLEAGQTVFSAPLRIPANLLKTSESFLHWGRYDAPGEPWCDEELNASDFIDNGDGSLTIKHAIQLKTRGHYGVTVFFRAQGSEERIWPNQCGFADAQFVLDEEPYENNDAAKREALIDNLELRADILKGLSSFDRFVRVIYRLAKTQRVRGLGKLLFDATKGDAELRKFISEYYQRIIIELTTERSAKERGRLKAVLSVLRTVGIGEVVFVAPEGPHAIAGGLAQVVVGLSKSLSQVGVSSTIITPLYEEAQGNKHKSAEALLKEGVNLNGKLVPIEELGEVKIDFGPTYFKGTTKVKTPPRIVTARVYGAENGGIRILFLRHEKLANCLYPPVPTEEQLRRAIFLSKGALEILRDRRFKVMPQIVISNDWVTALVPAYLQIEPRYRNDDLLKDVQTAHIIHNGGRDYQGRLPACQDGVDIWPLIGISREHYFGIADPNDKELLNITAAAVIHVRRAIITVSKPYAQQILTPAGGEGLQDLFRRRQNLIFGISNGIDLLGLRRIFWQLGESARKSLNFSSLAAQKFNNARLRRLLPSYKTATKIQVQRKSGLREDEKAILISLVGRLAEQKGIQLLTAEIAEKKISVLEAILCEHPTAQLLIGGPPSEGDPAVKALREEIDRLTKVYPGRIKGIFDFILHREALEITQASDFFLMPSRYEPGGITQLEALAAGTLVIARNIGGIAATLAKYRETTEQGTGFLFEEYSGKALYEAISSAISAFECADRRKRLMAQAALAENDWSHRLPKYIALFQHVAGVLDPRDLYPFLEPRAQTLASIRPHSSLG